KKFTAVVLLLCVSIVVSGKLRQIGDNGASQPKEASAQQKMLTQKLAALRQRSTADAGPKKLSEGEVQPPAGTSPLAKMKIIPKVTHVQQVPQTLPKSKVPAVESKSKVPAVESKSKVPAVESKSKAPAVESKSKAPAVESKSKAPAVESKSK
ncbi:hypothetical protein OTU49_012379, partial [Cherax quadricarinatus]